MTGARLEPEMLVGEHYRLRRLLGEGGMGHVWEAIHTSTGELRALKFLKSDKEEDRRRFLREVRAGAALRHPNVIAVHDFIEQRDGTLVIVMDLLQGETLGAVLKREGRIALPVLADVLLQVVSALEAAHAAGIVHRDLKPDNVFLCGGPATESSVKVLDFGVAKLLASEGLAARTQALTGTGSMVGTPYYMSPEQVFSEKDLDARADVWSLGIVMYECLAGVRPTEADTVGRVLKRIMVAEFDPIERHCADLPADIRSLVPRLLAASRDDRPDLAELRSILEAHADAPVDPHAATISGSGLLPPASRPSRAMPRAAPPEQAPVPQADTNSAVSMQPARRTRPTIRAIAVVAVALLAGTVLARQWGFAGAPQLEGAATSAYVVPVQTTPSVTATASVSTLAPPPSVGPAPIATAIADAGRAMNTTPVAPRSSVVSRPSCETSEVLSEGHCCPRGHVWLSGRCQRPFATTF